ncbi:unnamed protein product [Fraxinus pennsylvanica]|uniref:Glycoside hydrolase family 19 catalytic domain-containing protein n=1 Tax=Fraxinus pennsylvanica TaxID=56036 RepID=A0AAD2A044_9LAMI|nr:unnamed protein product [Fraxinus pennsylvanica]
MKILVLVFLCLSSPMGTLAQGGVGLIISKSLFDQMLKHRNDANCPANDFYTYEAFIAAANSFGAFGTTSNNDTRKWEIAAFLAQTSHETTCGWASAPDGPYSWGYCFKQEQGNPPDYCVASPQWPCAPAGRAIGSDLLNNPDAVANDPNHFIQNCIMVLDDTTRTHPTCHDAISGRRTPSTADLKARRRPCYGVVTNIINGEIECGKGLNPQVEDRIGFYKRYCDLLGVGYGPNLDCYSRRLVDKCVLRT